MARVAFVGLGNMGRAMAGRLLETGHQLNLYNRTASRAETLVRRGAQLYESPKEACKGVDAVISMVADDAASRAVWLEREGILAADLAKNGFAIECSTLSHEWVADLSTRCKAHGLRYIDAPVTGLPDVAAAGALTLLVGADANDLHAARGILDSLSRRIIRFGPIGAGTAYKLIINMMGAVQIASAAEALAIAERAGLDMAVVADAMATSQAASPQVIRNTARMVAGDHDRNIVFTSALRLKDVEYAVRFARAVGAGSPFGALAEGIYRQLCDMGYAGLNESKVIDVCRLSPMTDSQMPDQLSAAEIQEREEYIRGRPPRLPVLPPEERTERQQELLDEISMIVVDGVRKPREDKAALEILIRHAELYKAHVDVAQKYLSDCEMDIRDRELAILRIAWLSQAPFEWGSHVKIAKRNGITSEEIERVMQSSSAPAWSKQDRAIMRAMEELHFDSMITDATWADLQEFYNDKKLIELVILAGQYKTVAYYQNSLRLPLPAGNMGLLAR